MLELRNINVCIDGKRIVNDVNLRIGSGELHILMGKNGSGKSTLANAVMGMPNYDVEGSIILGGEDITHLGMDARARKGLFISFQNPVEIDEVRNSNFIRQAMRARGMEMSLKEFKTSLINHMREVGLDESFYSRSVNAGFSGGEKKKNELVQLLMLNPKYAILDEIDSGLDISSLSKVARVISRLQKNGMGILLITHNPAMAKHLNPDKIYLFDAGVIMKEGDARLMEEIEAEKWSDMQ